VRYLWIPMMALVLFGCDDTKVDAPGDLDSDPPVVEDCLDGVDNDSDGLSDCADDECASTCDVDGDGHDGTAFGGDDCDDNNGAVFPGNTEVCDGIDNNCDGLADEDDPNLDTSDSAWYADNDGDGFGSPAQVVYRCDPPSPDAVQNGDDCDDADPAVNPDMAEVCNGIDDNCDGNIDDDDPTVDPASMRSFWIDSDGDGFGDPIIQLDACRAPSGYVDNDLDCDDTDPVIGEMPEWFLDLDGDGFGAGAPVGPQCASPGVDYVPDSDQDCDDTDPLIYPGAYDYCGDYIDADCNGFDCCAGIGGTTLTGGPVDLYGFCWYLGGQGETCDSACAQLGGTNLAWTAEAAYADSCTLAGPDDVSTYFFNNGNPGGWTNAGGLTAAHTLGYGYANVGSYYGKCASGGVAIGTYPGDAAPVAGIALERQLVCACF